MTQTRRETVGTLAVSSELPDSIAGKLKWLGDRGHFGDILELCWQGKTGIAWRIL